MAIESGPLPKAAVYLRVNDPAKLNAATPPADPLPPLLRAHLARMDAVAARIIAGNPELAEAIRRRKEQEARDQAAAA